MAYTPLYQRLKDRLGTSGSSDYQQSLIREREDLIRQVGATVPEKKKPKVGFLQRIGIILDSVGAAIRTGIYAALTPEKESVLGSAGRAFVDRTQRKYGADILDQLGVKNKYGKAIGGFALEVALDPLTWMGDLFFRGATIATRSGELMKLNGPGTRLLQKAIERSGGNRAAAQRAVATIISKSPSAAEKFIDRGGLKMFGLQTPLTATKLEQLAKVTGISAARDRLAQTTLGKAGTAIAELLVPDKKFVNDMLASGVSKERARQVLRLRGASRGERALAVAGRTQYMKNQFDELVKAAPEFGITGKNAATRIAEGMPYAREQAAIVAKYGKDWIKLGPKIYAAEIERQLIKGVTGKRAIQAAKRAQQRFEDGYKIAKAMEGSTLPRGLQDVYSSILKTYDDIAKADKDLGFINGKIEDYLYRGTKRVEPASRLPGVSSKYGIIGTHAKERAFDTIVDIDLAPGWERQYDFLKGVTIRGVTSDINAINKAYVNNLAKLSGLPIEKFTPSREIVAYWNNLVTTLGGGGAETLARGGIRGIDDIASMTPAKLAGHLTEDMIEKLPIGGKMKTLMLQKIRIEKSMKTLAELPDSAFSPGTKKLINISKNLNKERESLQEALSIVISEGTNPTRGAEKIALKRAQLEGALAQTQHNLGLKLIEESKRLTSAAKRRAAGIQTKLIDLPEVSIPELVDTEKLWARLQTVEKQSARTEVALQKAATTEASKKLIEQTRQIQKINKAIAQDWATPTIREAQKLVEGTKKIIPPGWVDGASLKIPGTSGTFTDIMVPRGIANDLVKATAPFLDTNESKSLLAGLEWYMNQWKTGVTVWWPGFHIRNAISNIFNASYLGGADIRVFGEAIKYQRALAKGVGLDDAVNGTGMTLKEIDNAMIRFNIKGFGGQTEQALTGERGARMLAEALGQDGFSLYKHARGVGDAIETNAKMGLFIDRLRKGDSIDAAAFHVKKYLFDYADLTDFEQRAMKNLIPFYTWIRKNTPLQVEQLLKKPGKFLALGRALDAAGRMWGEGLTPEEQALLPDFALSGIGLDRINFGKDPEGKYRTLLSLGLPYEDLDKLGQAGKEILSALTPPLKYVLEEISGKEFFRDKPLDELNKISGYTGALIDNYASDKVKELFGFSRKDTDRGTTYRINAKLVHLLNQLPITRGGASLKKIEKLTSGDQEIINTALSLIVGTNIYNAEATDSFMNQARIEQLNKKIEELYPLIKKFDKLYIPKK